ncbi:MAG: AraC family transcriptional regulator [Prevotella sp.]|nr:AraC family transcriptional regulator [Prevotella sp.]
MAHPVTAQTVSQGDLWQRCENARSLCRYDSLTVYAAQLLSVSKRQDDRRGEAYALFYQGLSQLFSGQGKSSLLLLNSARDLAEDIENDSVMALVTNAMGIYHAMTENNSFVAQQFFFRSLDYAEKAQYEQLKGRVYGNLLTLTHSATDTAGITNARRIYDYGKKNDDYEQTFMGAYYQANYYNLIGDNQRAEAFLKEALDMYQVYPYDDVASVYTLYSKVKLDMGDIASAEQFARRAVILADSLHQPFLLPDTYLQYAEVLNRKGNYALSNDMAQKALDAAQEASGKTKVVACLRLMARNCERLGQNSKAMDCLERANLMMDTLTRVNMDRLNHERTIMLDIQKKEQEAQVRKQQMADQRRMNLFLVAAVALLLALLSVIAWLYRKRNVLYKNIVRQNAKSVARQKELQQRIDHLESAQEANQANQPNTPDAANEPNSPSEPNMPNEAKVQELYDRACHLMEHERLYADPQLNREHLAELLGTNRTYLSAIIKEKSGMSYLQFVNSYRINEAIRILSDPEKTDYPLKKIWSDLGFNSPATFYKLFQQAVGITPSVYRKQFLDLSQEEE